MSHPDNEAKIKVGITIGDLNGIGAEIIIKTFSDSRITQVCTPVIYASSKALSFHRKWMNANDFNYQTVRSINDVILRKINLINCWEEDIAIDLGQKTELGGRYALKSLQAATADIIAKKIDVLVTSPINKDNIQSKDFNFPGHTEYLANQANVTNYTMLLVNEGLRVGLVTGHMPLKDVASKITKQGIVAKLISINESMKKDFGIRKPKIAVLGLNPHAGDGGLLGTEERDIIVPAIKEALEKNMMVYGPYSADGFFATQQQSKFDAVLAMYHDQGLIPFKTLSFTSGVNYTTGLPFVRTSPDHGTGFDIAGKNIANEDSFRQAIYTGIDIFSQRNEYAGINANPLAYSKKNVDR